jgi:triosephosphate isomerase
MLKSLGVKYIIIGHSERRKHFKETNKIIEKKLKSALALGLKPILCIDKLSQIPKDINDDYILAYEPLFAIGTGEPCSAEKAKKMREKINKKLVLYGGSVNSKNAEDYIEKSGFQGLLVGGASLNAREFLKIIQKLKN